jgi:hypothetical protein
MAPLPGAWARRLSRILILADVERLRIVVRCVPARRPCWHVDGACRLGCAILELLKVR